MYIKEKVKKIAQCSNDVISKIINKEKERKKSRCNHTQKNQQSKNKISFHQMSIYQKESEGKGRGVREEGDTEEEEEEEEKIRKQQYPGPLNQRRTASIIIIVTDVPPVSTLHSQPIPSSSNQTH